MTVITVRVDEETKKLMESLEINWSEFIRQAVRERIREDHGKNLAKAVLINERLKRRTKGEMRTEDIIRKFREERHA
jgi:Arc/MetJ-type ribon-helix-helix transcriptional regulator